MSHPHLSPSQAPPVYSDLAGVLAGLSRMRDDINDIAGEIDPVIAAVTQAMLASGDKEGVRLALLNQQAQLVWLAAETGAMLAALAERKEGQAMSESRISHPEATSPVMQLYTLAESLRHLAATLPENQAGLALLLCIIGQEVKHCAAMLDNSE